MSDAALAWRNRAEAAIARGDFAAAARVYRDAVAALPDHALLLNSAGTFLSRQGRHAEALPLFERALAAAPGLPDAVLNRAIALSALGRHGEALTALDQPLAAMTALPRYWSTRASIARELGRLDDAADAYDALLAREPTHARGLHGRARVALERGEADMAARFERALPHNGAEPAAFLGYAQALDYAGRAAEALETARMLAERFPAWTDAQAFLAQMRWAAGDRAAFADHYTAAVVAAPGDPLLYLSWCGLLAGVDRFAAAAEVARRGLAACPGDPALALAAASHTSEAGELAAADALFAALPQQDADRWLHEARHRLRQQEPERAEGLLARVIDVLPDSVSGWALIDLAWRMLGDDRAAWLHGQPGLVTQRPLGVDGATQAAVVDVLTALHDGAAMPVGQSVRDGSQTRGGLFDRMEPELRTVRDAIMAVVADHRASLPDEDARHPLLRHRDSQWAMRGSWSIRVRGGRHTEHVHPAGILSSAAHLVIPADAGTDGAGCLELGRSPPDLGIGLEPITTITPVPWNCVLFPSTLYHGTRPFAAGERLTIAFDIALG